MSNTPRKPDIFSVKLGDELTYELEAAARRKSTTRASVVREALAEYVVRRRPSALDLAGDLVGRLNGPGDLSTNKKHLKGFGK